MSEQDNGQDNAAAQAQAEQPQIQIQRVYLKDMSFESPTSPQSFSGDWKPEIGVELNSKGRQLSDTAYEVVLNLTVTAKAEDNVMYLAEIQQAGLFHIANVPEQAMGQVLGAFCPNILFPYAREAVDNLVSRGSFPVLMLAPVNFDALYAQNMAQQQAAAAAEGEKEAEVEAETTH